MKRILVLVEGQTEENFVKQILNAYFLPKNICLHPTIINTKKVKGGPNYKGGITSYQRVRNDLFNLFKDTNAIAFTTMIDFYGLPSDFPAWSHVGDSYSMIAEAERVFSEDINNDKFIPYLQLHEFEGLLFSEPNVIASSLGRKELNHLLSIRSAFANPEEINNGPLTAPSKRLLAAYPGYNKVVYGSIIANEIGMALLLQECPHFNSWIQQLESICAE